MSPVLRPKWVLSLVVSTEQVTKDELLLVKSWEND